MFEPFERLGRAEGAGVGLGLAVADGLARAVGATIVVEDTPGADRTEEVAVPVVVAGDLTIDLARRTVVRAGQEVRLSPTEWGLLELLVRHRGRVVGREQLLREVWGPSAVRDTHYLRVYVAQLRRKLEEDPAAPRHLLTSPGMGYRFETHEGVIPDAL